GNIYDSWDLAETRLNNYAKAIGFSLCRKRVKSDNGEVRQHT
ncbi:4977_t:CDS:1, partial [Gigaspora rosea]